MDILLIIIAILLFAGLQAASWISLAENEKPAFLRLFISSFIIPLPWVFFAMVSISNQEVWAITWLFISFVSIIIFLIPLGKNKAYRQVIPQHRIDERDTMFSRNELKPGSENYLDYYKRNPDKKPLDDAWRKNAGLLNKGASQYNPYYFASADASFETIEALRDQVDGLVRQSRQDVDPKAISAYLQNWTKKLGAVDVGITELRDYHVYSTGGRAERHGKAFQPKHQFAIAFTVEMDKHMVDAAPGASIVMESGQQYLESGKISIQLAKFIRQLGYEARAHIDGNYQVVCPLVARDAGLGEIGRMGLLMTPKLGPRVRIGVVSTNLPLETNDPLHDYSTIDACIKCKKCAETCPGQAISFSDREEIDGVLRWQINQEKCFSTWTKLGTDCGRCIAVCPYSHPDNGMHNLIRAGIRNSVLFRNMALKLDDVLYGRKPPIKDLPHWMKL